MGLEVIQHLRGTAEENDLRVGYDGEFTVDKTNKAIRIHDGTTAGGSVVVSEESQRVSSVSELKNLHPSEYRVAILEGYNSPVDNGGGVFYWDSSGSASNSDGGVIISSDVQGFQQGDSKEGVWKRLVSGRTLNIEWWGPSSTDATDEVKDAFGSLPDYFDLRINTLLPVTERITLTSSNVNVVGNGKFELVNNSDYDQLIDITGNDVTWRVDIDQSSASAHNGEGRGIRVIGNDVSIKDVEFIGEDSNTPRPNVYIVSNGNVEFQSCRFDDATSSVIEYNGSGSVTVYNSEQDSSDNTVAFIDLIAGISPGDIQVIDLEVVTGNSLIAGNVADSVKIQRNSGSPRVFNGEQNPNQLGLSVAYNRGDQVKKSFVSAVGSIGWVCVSGGTPGNWKEFGQTKTEKSGDVLFDSDGETEQFRITHGLGGTPSVWNVTPTTADANVYSYVTANPNSLIVNYDYAPPSGTNNIGFNWRVDRNSIGMIDSEKTFLTENSGKATFDGNGSKTLFRVRHGLPGVPLVWDVTPSSDDASDFLNVRVNPHYLAVNFDSAPPNGSGNVEFNWSVDSGFFGESNEDAGGRGVFDGDGSKQSFTVNHNLDSNPIYWTAELFSIDSNIDYYVSTSSGQLTVNFESAPPSGTKNVKFSWVASLDEFADIVGENGGEDVFSGDGSSTTFSIPHGLGSTPSVWNVTPTSSDASGLSYVTADSSNLILNFNSAPPSGTNNVSVTWLAKS